MVGILNIRTRSAGVSDIDLGATRLGQYRTRPWTSVVYLAYQPNSYAIYITYPIVGNGTMKTILKDMSSTI